MAFNTEKLINILRDAKNVTANYPHGIAWKIVKELFRIFQPRDIMSEVYMKRRLDNIVWKADEAPDAFDSKVISIRNDCTDERDERTELACLISKAPEIYQAAISTEARRCTRNGDVIQYSDALDVCRDIYRQVHGIDGLVSSNKKKDKEVQLFTKDKSKGGKPGGRRELTCYKCLQKGHTVTKCTNNASANAKQCPDCGLWGHDSANCWEKADNASKRPSGWKSRRGVSAATTDRAVMLCNMAIPDDLDLLTDKCIFIADTACTDHTCADDCGMVNKTTEEVTFETNNKDASVKATETGTVTGVWCNRYGAEQFPFNIKINHCPEGRFNLLSISKFQQEGWLLHGDENRIWLTKGTTTLLFDIKISTRKSVLYCAYLKRDGCDSISTSRMQALETRESEFAQANLGMITPVSNPNNTIPIESAHARLGHMDAEKTRSISKHLRWNLSRGNLKPCAPCAVGKARKAAIKPPDDAAPVDNSERVFLDIASLRLTDEEKKMHEPMGTSFPNWRIMIYGACDFASSIFTTTKIAIVEPTCEELYKWTTLYKKTIKYLRMDGSGENKKLAERMKSADWKLPIQPEFTARDTPQQNSKAEVKFPTLVGRMKALFEHANIPRGIVRRRLFPHAANYVTKMSNFELVEVDGKLATRWEHMTGSLPNWTAHPRIWGEAGIVKLIGDNDSRDTNRGTECVFVDYPNTSMSDDTVRMWDPETERIHETRDVTWMKRMYFPAIANVPELLIDAAITARKRIDDSAAIIASENENEDSYDGVNLRQRKATTTPVLTSNYYAVLQDDDDEEDAVEQTSTAIVSTNSNNEEESEDEDEANQGEAESIFQDTQIVEGSSGSDVTHSNPPNQNTPRRSTRVPRQNSVLNIGSTKSQSYLEDTGDKFYDSREHSDTSNPSSNPSPDPHDDEQATSSNNNINDHDAAEFDEVNLFFNMGQWNNMYEVQLMGAALGGGFGNTEELHVMTYDEAMAKDEPGWMKSVYKEHDRMTEEHHVWDAVPPSEVEPTATVIDSTWAMKQKSDGTKRARLAGRGFWQIPGKDFDPDCLMAPVVAMLTIFIVLTLIVTCSWYCILIDLKGAFLTADFEPGRNIYMKIPKGFEKFYPIGWLLRLNKTIYGTKQASRQFWIKLYKALEDCGYKRSNMDQCLYFKWHEKYGLTLIISWVDDLMVCGKQEACMEFKEEIKKKFEIDDIGEMKEYVGCKIDRTEDQMKMTQPVLIQSLEDEFEVKTVRLQDSSISWNIHSTLR